MLRKKVLEWNVRDDILLDYINTCNHPHIYWHTSDYIIWCQSFKLSTILNFLIKGLLSFQIMFYTEGQRNFFPGFFYQLTDEDMEKKIMATWLRSCAW